MSATAHLGRLVSANPSHESALTRLRLRVRRDELDRKLAAGADPHRHDDVGRRAEELTGTEERQRRRCGACYAFFGDRGDEVTATMTKHSISTSPASSLKIVKSVH